MVNRASSEGSVFITVLIFWPKCRRLFCHWPCWATHTHRQMLSLLFYSKHQSYCLFLATLQSQLFLQCVLLSLFTYRQVKGSVDHVCCTNVPDLRSHSTNDNGLFEERSTRCLWLRSFAHTRYISLVRQGLNLSPKVKCIIISNLVTWLTTILRK